MTAAMLDTRPGPTPASPAGDPGPSRGLIGTVTVGAVIGFVMLYLLAVHTTAGQQADQAAMESVSAAFGATASWATATLEAVSASAMLLATALLAVVTAARRGVRRAVVAVASAGAVFVAAEVLKLSLLRPGLLDATAGNSFPSGHVAAVAGFAVALVVALPRTLRRPVALLVATPAVVLTGLATVVVLWHRPSDVIGSILLAVAVGGAAVRLADHESGRPGTVLTAR